MNSIESMIVNSNNKELLALLSGYASCLDSEMLTRTKGFPKMTEIRALIQKLRKDGAELTHKEEASLARFIAWFRNGVGRDNQVKERIKALHNSIRQMRFTRKQKQIIKQNSIKQKYVSQRVSPKYCLAKREVFDDFEDFCECTDCCPDDNDIQDLRKDSSISNNLKAALDELIPMLRSAGKKIPVELNDEEYEVLLIDILGMMRESAT